MRVGDNVTVQPSAHVFGNPVGTNGGLREFIQLRFRERGELRGVQDLWDRGYILKGYLGCCGAWFGRENLAHPAVFLVEGLKL